MELEMICQRSTEGDPGDGAPAFQRETTKVRILIFFSFFFLREHSEG